MEKLLMDTLLQVLPTIITGILAYLMRQSHTRHTKELAEQRRLADEQKRIADEQNNEHKLQIQALQNENTQTQAQLEIIKEYATGTPKMQETWQSVLNTMSARRLEGDKEMAQALREIAQTSRVYTQEIDDFGSILEIHTTTHGLLEKKIDDGVSATKTTAAAVESQKEELQLVSKSIGTLTNRLDDLIAVDETHVLDEGTRYNSLKDDNREHKNELVAIKNALLTGNSILEKIVKRMENATQPLPQAVTPETWHEDSEATVIIPPRKLADADGNPLPVPPPDTSTPDNENKLSA
jgi:chromosome segregation ATPase